jgi:membrane protein
VKPTKRAIDWFLGALAVGAAARVLFRSKRIEPQPETSSFGPPAAQSRKQWAGSLVRTVRYEVRQDETVIIAAALAFYAMLALLPAAIAAISIYGLFLDPADVVSQIETITDVLPKSIEELVSSQIERLADSPTAGLGVSAVASLLGALWVASSGTRSLLHGINIVYNVEERRRWVVQRAIAYGLTLGLIIFGLTTIGVVTFLPDWLEDLGFGSTGVLAVEIARWPMIFAIVVLGLVLLYRIGPNRRRVTHQRLFPGAVTAAVLWMIATIGFSIYTSSGFSSFDVPTYGTLLAAVVLLVWFFASGFAILIGAEVNASLEAQQRPT